MFSAYSENFYVLVPLGTVVLLCTFFLCRRVVVSERVRSIAIGLFGSSNRYKEYAEDASVRFFRQVRALEEKKEVVDVYAPEYFNTLQEAGWQTFNSLLERLFEARSILQTYLERKNYEDAALLAAYLLGELKGEDVFAAQQRFRFVGGLQDWKSVMNGALINVARRLEDAAKDTQALGVDRSQRSRKPTLMMVSDIISQLQR